MLSRNLLVQALKALNIRKYPTAGRNAHFLRIARQALPYYLRRDGFSFPPLSVFIHVNTTCNLRCAMCDAGQNVQDSTFYGNLKGTNSGDLSLEDFRTLIDKVRPARPFIGIPALEPLLHERIADMIAYVRDCGLSSSIATNATLLEHRAEDLVRAGLTRLVVSLDGSRETHDRVRGVPGTFDKVLAGLAALRQAKERLGSETPHVYVNYVIFDFNHRDMAALVRQLPLEAVAQIDFRVMFYCTQELADAHNAVWGSRYHASEVALGGGADLSRVDADAILEQMAEVRTLTDKAHLFFNHGRDKLAEYYRTDQTFLDGTPCVWPWYTLQVNNEGEASAFQRCFNLKFGNLLRQDLDEVWNGPVMRAFRKDLQRHKRFPICTRCEGINF